MAITAVAALAGAGGVAAGIVAVETLAIVATVTSVVGAVTGNKTLQKLGMGMGLAAAGAGLMANAGEGAASVSSEVASKNAVEHAASETSNLASRFPAPESLANQASTVASSAPSVAVDSGLSGAPDILANTNATSYVQPETIGGLGSSPGASTAATEAAKSGAGAASSLDVGAPTTPADSVAKLGANAPSGPTSPYDSSLGGKDPFGANTIDSSKNFFSNTWDKTSAWLEKNPKTANTLLQVGGNIASGIAKSAESDRLYGLQSQQLQMQQQQAANAKAIPTIGSIINPNYVRSGPGIVSNALGK